MLLLDLLTERKLEAQREAAALARLVALATDVGERQRALTRLALIDTALEAAGRGRIAPHDAYRERIVARLDRPRQPARAPGPRRRYVLTRRGSAGCP